jgi:hypothetical protein
MCSSDACRAMMQQVSAGTEVTCKPSKQAGNTMQQVPCPMTLRLTSSLLCVEENMMGLLE